MATSALGTSGNDLAHVMSLNSGYLYHHGESAPRASYESDQSQSTRYFPARIIPLIPNPPTQIELKFPSQALVDSFQRGEYRHLDFNPRDRLGQTFDSGMALGRSMGYLNALWNKALLKAEVAEFFRNKEKNDPFIILVHLDGGTGSSALFALLETIDQYVNECGASFNTEIHVVAMAHPVGASDSLSEVKLANEVAATTEFFTLQSQGACFSEADRNDWNPPRQFSGRVHFWLFQDPGDRSQSPQQIIATAGALLHNLFEHPQCSPVFHRDATDRFNNTEESPPLYQSFGFSRIFDPNSERETYLKNRLMRDILRQTLAPSDQPEREAKTFIHQNLIADNGRSRGRSHLILERSFSGSSPIREKLTRKPPSGLLVPTVMRSVGLQSERIRQDCLGLLKCVKQTAEKIQPEIAQMVDKKIVDLLRIRSAAAVLEIARSIRERVNGMSMALQGEIVNRQTLKDQVCRQYSRFEEHFQRLRRSGLFSRVSIDYQSLPQKAWGQRMREISLETDIGLFEITLESQRDLASPSSLEERLQHLLHELATSQTQIESALRIIQTSDFTHRGLGYSLTEPADFEHEYLQSDILRKYGSRIAGEFRNFLTDKLLQEGAALTQHEIHEFLEERVATVPLPDPLSMIQSVQKHPDRKGMFRGAITQAKPLVSIDPRHEASNELFVVWLPRGSENPLADEITQAAKSEKCPVPPTFHHWEEQEIAFIRILFNTPAKYMESLKRANRTFDSLSREEQISAFRLPILWLLPRPGKELTHRDLMKLFAMGGIAGFFTKKEKWIFTAKEGTKTPLADLSPESLANIFSTYRNATECASWFCHETLCRGFTWSKSRLNELGSDGDLNTGEWPKILLELSEEIDELARHHHQTMTE